MLPFETRVLLKRVGCVTQVVENLRGRRVGALSGFRTHFDSWGVKAGPQLLERGYEKPSGYKWIEALGGSSQCNVDECARDCLLENSARDEIACELPQLSVEFVGVRNILGRYLGPSKALELAFADSAVRRERCDEVFESCLRAD